eukprot:Colp12_sorted_trinity150504_noHs@10774
MAQNDGLQTVTEQSLLPDKTIQRALSEPGTETSQPVEESSTHPHIPVKRRRSKSGGVSMENKFYEVKLKLLERFAKDKSGLITEAGITPEKLEWLSSLSEQYNEYIENLKAYVAAIQELATTQSKLSCYLQEQGEIGNLFIDSTVKEAGDTLAQVSSNTSHLQPVLDRMLEDLTTFRDKAITDTEDTIVKMEAARVSYDVSRLRRRSKTSLHTSEAADGKAEVSADETEESLKLAYSELVEATSTKLQFLESKRTESLQGHLLRYHHALDHFYANNSSVIEKMVAERQQAVGREDNSVRC